MADPIVPVSFTSTPAGRAIKTVGAGLLGACATACFSYLSDSTKIQPLVNLVSDPLYQKVIFMAVTGALSWIGRWAKNKGFDLQVI